MWQGMVPLSLPYKDCCANSCYCTTVGASSSSEGEPLPHHYHCPPPLLAPAFPLPATIPSRTATRAVWQQEGVIKYAACQGGHKNIRKAMVDQANNPSSQMLCFTKWPKKKVHGNPRGMQEVPRAAAPWHLDHPQSCRSGPHCFKCVARLSITPVQ